MFLTTSPITFPGLGIDINPADGFTLFGVEIKFYALVICLGLILAVVYCLRRCKEFGLSTDDILDVVIVGLPCAIVGARLYYVVFEWDRFFVHNEHWYDFLNIRQGGLAIYGGLIGAVLGVGIFFRLSKKRRGRFIPAIDMAGLGFLIGQSIGRWGNFFNREAHGGETESFLRMGLIEGGQQVYVHPTFLYESVWNAIGFVLIHFLSKKRKFDGQVFLYYLAWYGLGRAWIEGMRTDSLWWGPFRVSQVLAIATFLIATGLLVYMLLIKKPDPAKMLVNRKAAEEAAAEEE